ncbi:MAG: Fic family protein [Treponema sp.]|nr:Fic family protein [Treponema sp.]
MKSVEQIVSEYNSLGINQQLDYDKFYLYSIITHSTAIEGSTITEIENQLLFDEGLGSNKPIKEQMMNLDLKKAYEKSFEYAKNHEKITVEMLSTLSGILMQNTGSEYKTIAGNFSAAKGELRLVNVSAGRGGKSYMAWQKVPLKLQEFCDWLNGERKKLDNMSLEEKYKLSFEAHYQLVSIHPFADGNGRMGRLLMNMIQYEAGIVPSIVKKENRVEYIKSLSESQDKEDSSGFIDFMMNHHKDNLLQQVDEYKKSIQSESKQEHHKHKRNSGWSW